jgi:hypothetical protein
MTEEQRMTSFGFTSERFPAGCHMCYIYNDEEERQEVIARFIESGLAEGEYIFYLVDNMSPEAMRSHLLEKGIQLPADIDEPRFKIFQASEAYCPEGVFSPEYMLHKLSDIYQHSMAEGFAGCRGMGEMAWALRGIPGSERLIEYEARINQVVRTSPLNAICQYNANLFDGATIFKVLNVHPMMVVRGQVVKNPYYMPPEAYLASQSLPF